MNRVKLSLTVLTNLNQKNFKCQDKDILREDLLAGYLYEWIKGVI